MTRTSELELASNHPDYADRKDAACGAILTLTALAAFVYGLGHEPYARNIDKIFVYCFGCDPGLDRLGFYFFIMATMVMIVFFGMLIGVNLSFKWQGKKSSR